MSKLPEPGGPIARLLAGVAMGLKPEVIPEPAMQWARMCVLDYLGATLAGLQEGPGATVRKWVIEQGGKPDSTVIGTSSKVPACNAALANGTSGHMVELDDVHSACIGHPGVVVVPAALALAETLHLDGLKFLSSVVAGYEVMARSGAYMGISHYAVWHPTATLGTLGSAAASIQAMDLGLSQAENAIAIAATMASGFREVFVGGSNCKHIHPGLASRNGIIAAELAAGGFTGPKTAIEGTMGFRQAHSGEGHEEALNGLPGGRLHIQDTEFKVFASCRSAHTAAEAGILTNLAGVTPDLVEDIVLEIPTVTAKDPAWGNLSPGNSLAAKLSIPYNFVVSMVDGQCYLGQFTQERVEDTVIQSLLSRTVVIASEELDAVYPEHVGVKAAVRLQAGDFINRSVIIPIGHPLRPLDEATVRTKFMELAVPVIGSNAERLKQLVLGLGSTVAAKEILELCRAYQE